MQTQKRNVKICLNENETETEKRKRENTKRNEKVSEPLRSLDCRACTAIVSCATEALKRS